jgi:hypothetical protein
MRKDIGSRGENGVECEKEKKTSQANITMLLYINIRQMLKVSKVLE